MSSIPESVVREAEPQPSDLRMPPLILAAAGLTVLNGVIAVCCFVVWLFAPEAALQAIRASSGFGLLLGMAGVSIGAWAQRKQKRAKDDRGLNWTTAAVLAGLAAMLVCLLIPMFAAIKSMVGPEA